MAAQEKRTLRSLGIALALLGIPSLAGIIPAMIRDHQSARTRHTASALDEQTRALIASRPELADFDRLRSLNIFHSEVVGSLAEDRFLLAELMEWLSSVPDGITLRRIHFDSGWLEISGSTRSEQAPADLVAAMRKLSGWRDVVLEQGHGDDRSPLFLIRARQSVDAHSEQGPGR